MKVHVLQEDLYNGLRQVSRAVSARSSLPVLGHVLFRVEDGRLLLAGTNLEIMSSTRVSAKVEADGGVATTIPARTILDLVKALPQEQVTLTVEPDAATMHISCARTEANVKGIDAEEFPQIPAWDGAQTLTLSAETFSRAIDRTVFSAANDAARPTLTGGYLQANGLGNLTLAATDGFRLSEVAYATEDAVADAITRIIPARALEEVSRIAGENECEEISLSFADERSQVLFELGKSELVSQTIDGNYPEYGRVIEPARNHQVRATVDAARLVKAVRLAEVFAREASHTVNLALANDLTGGYITVRGKASEMGDQKDVVDAEIEGEADGLDINVNARYLLDVLNVMGSPQVHIDLKGAHEPLLIHPAVHKEGEEFVHIIMPMQTGR